MAPQSCTQQVFHIGQPCLVAVTYHPTGTGLRNAQLQINRASHKTTLDSGLIQGASSLAASPAVVERVSLGPIGAPGVGPTGQINDDSSFSGALSANGRFVSFTTDAGLDPRDNNNSHDVYVRDRLRATTTLLSIPTGAANVVRGGWQLVEALG